MNVVSTRISPRSNMASRSPNLGTASAGQTLSNGASTSRCEYADSNSSSCQAQQKVTTNIENRILLKSLTPNDRSDTDSADRLSRCRPWLSATLASRSGNAKKTTLQHTRLCPRRYNDRHCVNRIENNGNPTPAHCSDTGLLHARWLCDC